MTRIAENASSSPMADKIDKIILGHPKGVYTLKEKKRKKKMIDSDIDTMR